MKMNGRFICIIKHCAGRFGVRLFWFSGEQNKRKSIRRLEADRRQPGEQRRSGQLTPEISADRPARRCGFARYHIIIWRSLASASIKWRLQVLFYAHIRRLTSRSLSGYSLELTRRHLNRANQEARRVRRHRSCRRRSRLFVAARFGRSEHSEPAHDQWPLVICTRVICLANSVLGSLSLVLIVRELTDRI